MNKKGYFYLGLFLSFVIIFVITPSLIIYNLNEKIEEQDNTIISQGVLIEQQHDVIDYLGDLNYKLHQKNKDLKNFINQVSETEKLIINEFIKDVNRNINDDLANKISDNVLYYSDKYGVSHELILGIIFVESRFNPNAVSKAKARGLMQVMPMWVSHFEFVKNSNDLHKVDIGIKAGINVFLVHLRESNDDVCRALYYYVGRDQSYVNLVYTAISKYLIFKTNILTGEEWKNTYGTYETTTASN